MPKRIADAAAITYSVTRKPVIECQSAKLLEQIVLPTFYESGLECVPINSSDRWLNKALRVEDAEQRDIIFQFITEVTRGLRSEGDLQVKDDDEEVVGTAPSQKKGRAALGVDSDSDEEELGIAQAEEKGAKKRPKREHCLDFRTISLSNGFQITAKRRKRGTGIIVPVDNKLPELFREMQARLSEGSNSDVEARASKRARRQKENEQVNVQPGKLRWQSGSQSGWWVVVYRDAKGQLHQTKQNLEVSRYDIAGTMLQADVFKANRETVRQKALRMWNELDKSEEPRSAVE